MTEDAAATSAKPRAAAEDRSIRPFTYRASEAELDELRRRILAARLPEKETKPGRAARDRPEAQGLLGKSYDWRKVETRLNALPNFVTTSGRLIDPATHNSIPLASEFLDLGNDFAATTPSLFRQLSRFPAALCTSSISKAMERW